MGLYRCYIGLYGGYFGGFSILKGCMGVILVLYGTI